MMRRLGNAILLAVVLASAARCGPQLDLAKLEPTEILTGYYDDGVRDGLNRLLPSISFRLKNNDAVPASEVQLTVSFWRDGDDGEKDALEISGIGSDQVSPGNATPPILVRAKVGYTLEQPRDELFTHSQFKDFTAKIFAKRGGKIVPIGQFRIDRRILPHVSTSASS
jgi:hypothetical protein